LVEKWHCGYNNICIKTAEIHLEYGERIKDELDINLVSVIHFYDRTLPASV
jgi:hypothetical protein